MSNCGEVRGMRIDETPVAWCSNKNVSTKLESLLESELDICDVKASRLLNCKATSDPRVSSVKLAMKLDRIIKDASFKITKRQRANLDSYLNLLK
jgi:hypothetical protein